MTKDANNTPEENPSNSTPLRETALTAALDEVEKALDMGSSPAIKMKHNALRAALSVKDEDCVDAFAVRYCLMREVIDEYCGQALEAIRKARR